MGKHTSMTASKLEEFKKAFSMGFTKAEAILYCNVPERTFFDYCSKNPEFTELIPTLQNLPKLKAKMVILGKIEEKDDFNSRWYLEKTDKDFNPKSVVEQTVKADVEVTKNQQGLLDRLIG